MRERVPFYPSHNKPKQRGRGCSRVSCATPFIKMTLPAAVMWAQRKNMIYITICVEDCKDAVVTIEPSKVFFKGTGGTEHKLYENTLELFEDIDAENSRKVVRDRNIEVMLMKKESGPFWPHLLKQKIKQHWLKVDFSKWKDEDDDSDVEGEDFQQMMQQMGSLNPGAGDEGFGRPPRVNATMHRVIQWSFPAFLHRVALLDLSTQPLIILFF
ncbi:CS domain [Trinorchestia longiramus]|nr:CS domain [Trinorchestia longiramus]